MIIYPYETMTRIEKGEKNPIDDFIDKHWSKNRDYLKFVSDLETALCYVAENYDILSDHLVYENWSRQRNCPIRNMWRRIGRDIPDEGSSVCVAELFIAKNCRMVIGDFSDIAVYIDGNFVLANNSAHVLVKKYMVGSKVPSICTHWHYANYTR